MQGTAGDCSGCWHVQFVTPACHSAAWRTCTCLLVVAECSAPHTVKHSDSYALCEGAYLAHSLLEETTAPLPAYVRSAYSKASWPPTLAFLYAAAGGKAAEDHAGSAGHSGSCEPSSLPLRISMSCSWRGRQGAWGHLGPRDDHSGLRLHPLRLPNTTAALYCVPPKAADGKAVKHHPACCLPDSTL